MGSHLGSKRTFGVLLSTGVLLIGIGVYYGLMIRSEAPSDAFENKSQGGQVPKLSDDVEKALETTSDGLSKLTVVLQTTRGKIKFKFYSKDAPKTTHRMAELIKSGFYNGLTFHRVVPGFVVQGGDPTGTGMGGSGVMQVAEFNSRKHSLGAVAMARAQDPNSADSQFYITLAPQPQLDGKYTVFGQVIEGQEVVNQIQMGDRMTAVSLDFQ